MAQLPKGHALEVNGYLGHPVKHTPELLFDNDHASYGIEINYLIQTYGRQDWQYAMNYPLLGFSLTANQIGRYDVFGVGFGFTPHVTIPLSRTSKWRPYFRTGSGAAFVTRTYNRISNPTNNAIGSNWNNITFFKFGFARQINPQHALSGGFSFTHYSNGASQLPNFGINIPAFYLGWKFQPQPLGTEDFLTGPKPRPDRRWGFTTYAAVAYRETIAVGGPRYPVYQASLAVLYRMRKYNHLLIGVEHEFNKGIYRFAQHVFAFETEQQARQGARRWMVFVADEVLLGRIAVLFSAGVYINKNAYLKPFFLYNRLGIRYYLPEIKSLGAGAYAGVYLKSHKSVAEYISIGFGVRY